MRKLAITSLPITSLLVVALAIGIVSSLPQRQQAQAAPLPVGDIVFMIDESGSMDVDIAEVQANANNMVSQLGASVDFQLGLVGFGAGIDAPGHALNFSGEPHIHSALTSDVAAFSSAVGELVADGGDEIGFSATVLAMSDAMGFRTGAGVCAIMISDEESDNGDPATKAQALAALNARSAAFLGIVSPDPTQEDTDETADDYGPNPGSLAAETGGETFDILAFRADPQAVLTAIIDTCIAVIQERAATPTPTATPAALAEAQSPTTPTPTPTATPTSTATPTPTQEAAPAEELPATGGQPPDGGSSGLPWLAVIAGAIAVTSAGGFWFARRRRPVR